ncbi:hypothetical protein NL676_008426 [Syzygium grande]|nr:hypothetical protein NL676_008426 [Syzygium grande]
MISAGVTIYPSLARSAVILRRAARRPSRMTMGMGFGFSGQLLRHGFLRWRSAPPDLFNAAPPLTRPPSSLPSRLLLLLSGRLRRRPNRSPVRVGCQSTDRLAFSRALKLPPHEGNGYKCMVSGPGQRIINLYQA